METSFESQIEGVLAATEKLVSPTYKIPLLGSLIPFQQSYFKRIGARMGKLEELDELARKALEERELRYKEWKAWKPYPVPPTATGLWPRSKTRDPPASTERTLADAYNLAGQRSAITIRLITPSDPSRIPKTCKSDDGSARPK